MTLRDTLTLPGGPDSWEAVPGRACMAIGKRSAHESVDSEEGRPPGHGAVGRAQSERNKEAQAADLLSVGPGTPPACPRPSVCPLLGLCSWGGAMRLPTWFLGLRARTEFPGIQLADGKSWDSSACRTGGSPS